MGMETTYDWVATEDANGSLVLTVFAGMEVYIFEGFEALPWGSLVRVTGEVSADMNEVVEAARREGAPEVDPDLVESYVHDLLVRPHVSRKVQIVAARYKKDAETAFWPERMQEGARRAFGSKVSNRLGPQDRSAAFRSPGNTAGRHAVVRPTPRGVW